jgi:hypothetical protein
MVPRAGLADFDQDQLCPLPDITAETIKLVAKPESAHGTFESVRSLRLVRRNVQKNV